MALDVRGHRTRARAGYEWLKREQRADGSWAARYASDGSVLDATAESNHAAYVAVGVLHHWLSGYGDECLEMMWPTVRRALDFVLGLANPDGTIGWARSPEGSPDPAALLTGCSSIHHALRCGVRIALVMGRPDIAGEWERAAHRLAEAITAHCAGASVTSFAKVPTPSVFIDRDRYSMDWYYPVLGGVLRDKDADERFAARWERFVVPGKGIRCVDDRPWVTGAETCELALALAGVGDLERATEMVAAMQHLREQDGSYWTGLVLEDGKRWPVERSTWTGAAMVLAVDLIQGGKATGEVFGHRWAEDDDLGLLA
nr:prenyltransferase/squalene oxidase repeat-containing protein [Kineosporia babensis]